MLQLGMDAEGTELRAKMQLPSLLSDMESFKAANPGAILSDFVRWHSPRDWEDEKHGKKVSRISHLLRALIRHYCVPEWVDLFNMAHYYIISGKIKC